MIRTKHPGARTILWDYKNAYYSWGILASAGAFVFKKQHTDYDLHDVGVATPGAVTGLSKIIDLVHAGILPTGPVNGEGEVLMAEGKLAMIISGPWDWPNLIQNGIDFELAPMPGIGGERGRPFVGVTTPRGATGRFRKLPLKASLEFGENLLTVERRFRAACSAG